MFVSSKKAKCYFAFLVNLINVSETEYQVPVDLLRHLYLPRSDELLYLIFQHIQVVNFLSLITYNDHLKRREILRFQRNVSYRDDHYPYKL